jgi:hypothetical protein
LILNRQESASAVNSSLTAEADSVDAGSGW